MSPERKSIEFRAENHNIYPGPNVENIPIDPAKILKMRVVMLSLEDQEKYPGWIVVEVEERIGEKKSTRHGFLIAPDAVRTKIFEEIEYMQSILDGEISLPLINKFYEQIRNCNIWIGTPLNPELSHTD